MLSANERVLLIDKLRQLPQQVADLVVTLTPTQLTTHYLPTEWTVAQNVHHLVDSHMNSYIRCKLIATEDNPPLKPYNQDQWALFPDAHTADIAISLSLLRGLHTRWVHFWETLPDEAWARTGLHPEAGVVSLADILRSYAAHGEAHLDQIRRTLAER